MSEEFRLQQRLGNSGAIDREERASGPCRFVVNESRQSLLSGPAFTGDQHGRVDLRDPPREIERPNHRWTGADQTGRRRRVDAQHATGSELLFLLLENVGQLGERRIEARLLIERQMHREFWSPLLLGADDGSTDRIPFAPTAIFDGDDLFAIDTGHVSTGEAHQGPADRLVRLSEMQQMLLRLVRIVPDAFGAGGGGTERSTRHLRAHETLYRVQARSRGAPVVLAVPGKSLPKRFGDAPSVCVTESGEYGPRRGRAERLDELLSEEPERHRIEQEHAFAGEGDEPTLGNEMQQFVNIEIGGAHETSARPFQNES